MDPFTAAYLAELAAALSDRVIAKVARRARDEWQGDETARAMERCLHAGVLGMVSKASRDEPDEEALLADIFSDFFRKRAVTTEVTRLVRGDNPSVAELEDLFHDAGYDPDTLPGLRFPEAVAAFEAAFLEAAAAEPALQPLIQVHQGWAQTALQRQMVALMRQMVAALRQYAGQNVSIEAGRIVAENVVSGTQQIGTQIIYHWPDEPVQDDAARTAYITWLVTERETLPLRAISAGKTGGTARPPELAQVYVALNTTTAVAGESQSPREEKEPLSALAALAERQQMVLLGDPGSGKSTFVSHLAYCLAAHALHPGGQWLAQLSDWPEENADLLPLLVVLRDFARWLPDPLPPQAHAHHLWDFIAETLRKEKLEAALPLVEMTLNDGRALLLLDGLDEVTTVSHRRFVRDAVLAFVRRYGGCHLLVTCRVFSYQAPDLEREEVDLRLPPADFPALELAPFDDEQRDAFIHTWYGELKRQGHLPGLDEARLSRDLQRAIRRSDLRRVAGNPLLLTVMAMVHAEEGRLPDSRALLYEKTIDLLLLRWEETKGEDDVPLLRQLLQEANRRDVDLKARLAAVAFAVHTQAGSGGEGDGVADVGEGYLCRELSRLHKKDLGWGQRLLAVIKTRAGLLVERSPGQFAFPHRTFQEYLAGVHLATQPDFAEEALKWAREGSGWWPMVLFAVEYLVYVTPRWYEPLKLVSLLCPEAAAQTTTAWQEAWLAGDVLLSLGQERAEDSEWGQQLLQRVRRRLAALLDGGRLSPRERAEAGKVLGRLGDPRPGVGVVVRDGQTLPDIAWGERVPAGTYTVGGDKEARNSFAKQQVTIPHAYRLARYPVTGAQIRCFVDAEDFADARWWAGMPEEVEDLLGNRYPLWEVGEQAFPYGNHPRERISWYQALAFCRWLTAKLHAGALPAGPLAGDPEQYTITLPHEYEREVAARWPNEGVEERVYPWGPAFDATKANTREGNIRQTTAVGMYPSGRNTTLDLYDLSGNVWEWCRNRYEAPNEDIDPERVDTGDALCVVRGGSWDSYHYDARAASRGGHPAPDIHSDLVGFRVVVRRPPSHHAP